MTDDRRADTSVPIHDLLANRWSPRSFTDEAVTEKQLTAVLEAARWTMSSYNDQPWSFIVARREDADDFQRLLGLLVEQNQVWAKNAAVLWITCAREAFERTGKPNAHARHDCGAANALATVQAEALGLAVHQMAGFDAERAKTELNLPAGVVAVTAVAMGHTGPAERLPDKLAEAERAPRKRKPLDEIVHRGTW
ncbi:MAG: nitroreductase family protein [Planctomycetota bacterium]